MLSLAAPAPTAAFLVTIHFLRHGRTCTTDVHVEARLARDARAQLESGGYPVSRVRLA